MNNSTGKNTRRSVVRPLRPKDWGTGPMQGWKEPGDPQLMVCQDCDRDFDGDGAIDFLVNTSIWNYVMAGQAQTTYTIRPGVHDRTLAPRTEGVGGTVCLACFDRRARALGVPYLDRLGEL